jgi:hypothetical protein
VNTNGEQAYLVVEVINLVLRGPQRLESRLLRIVQICGRQTINAEDSMEGMLSMRTVFAVANAPIHIRDVVVQTRHALQRTRTHKKPALKKRSSRKDGHPERTCRTQ